MAGEDDLDGAGEVVAHGFVGAAAEDDGGVGDAVSVLAFIRGEVPREVAVVADDVVVGDGCHRDQFHTQPGATG